MWKFLCLVLIHIYNGVSGNNIQVDVPSNLHPQIHIFPNTSIPDQQFHEFLYDGPMGSNKWPAMFSSCSGVRQSPIAIERKKSKPVSYEPFIVRNYNRTPDHATIINNGHTAMIIIPNEASVKGGHLPGEFEFLNLHFHWGSDSSRGSEHVIEGIHYPLELHVVHWNLKYSSSNEAMKHGDGIAVLAILFHVEPLENSLLEPIIEALGGVIRSGTNMTFTPKFKLVDLFPPDSSKYYRYDGSLTTPECWESVIWTVFANTLPISESQLNAFRLLLDSENKDRENNYRPVQPLNSRTIYLSGVMRS